MPLNPPSYKGQDVWYSPNVYVNKVPVALWQPPQVGDSLVFNFTLPPDPSAGAFAPEVLEFYNNFQEEEALANPYNYGFTVTKGQNVGQTINIFGGAAPPRGATPDNLAGTPEVVQSNLQLPPGYGPWQTLQANLNAAVGEAAKGLWDNKNSDNPNVRACFNELGRAETFSNAWCAAFANTMLKRSGISYNGQDLFARTFKNLPWGKSIPLNDYSQWRENDIVVFAERHVAFLKGVNLGEGRVEYLGGNQSGVSGYRDKGDLTQAISKKGGISEVSYVGRAWSLPPEVDKPLF